MKGVTQPRAITCAVCGSTFVTRHSQGKYCSPPCARSGERKSWREYGHRNRDDRRAYQQDLYRRHPEAVSARVAAYHKTAAGKAAKKVNDARQREKFPEKYQARQEVLKAVRSGRLIKLPCQHCGATKTQAHHHDYTKPLDVEWLCAPCHRAEHGTVGIVMEDGHVKGAEIIEEAAQ